MINYYFCSKLGWQNRKYMHIFLFCKGNLMHKYQIFKIKGGQFPPTHPFLTPHASAPAHGRKLLATIEQ